MAMKAKINNRLVKKILTYCNDACDNRKAIKAELKKRIEGDIRFDKYSRLLYSTDASIYQIEPIGVVSGQPET